MSPGPRAISPDAAFACVATAWQAHESELHVFLRRRLADADAADDVLQDVFVKAMRHGQGFCNLDNPRAWLFQVARTTLIDRSRTAHPVEPLGEGDQEPADVQEDTAPAIDALAGCLERTLAELADEDRAILQACDIGGMTQRAFADAHDVSLPAAKSRLLRARQRLRDRLTTVCRVHFDPADGRVSGHDGRAGPRAPSIG
jgi:RNA polymerase sigma-70 factor (ECF subfamily)